MTPSEVPRPPPASDQVTRRGVNFSCFDCNTGREGSHTETRPGGADRASQLSLHIHQKG